MFKFVRDVVNDREYDLRNNTRLIDISVTRIKNIREFKNSLISLSEIDSEKGYFIYNEPNFASLGLKNEIDIIWTNWDGKIIHLEENYKTNKISQNFKDTKFIYLFKAGTINRKRIILNDVITHFYNRKKNKNNSFL